MGLPTSDGLMNKGEGPEKEGSVLGGKKENQLGSASLQVNGVYS